MALQLGVFREVYQVGFLPVCKGTSQVVCPAVCPAAWEEGCLEDQVDLYLNNYHPTPVQGPVLCRVCLINLIPHIKATRHFNRPDNKGYPLKWEWDIQVQRRRKTCWLSRTVIWKPSKGGTLKKENRELEAA